ncbi:hypothetical protein ATCC90586_005666 [Pythium insidiosum]|nr:hypothetical protein ATCC90586_005666 [Pythium insidiosum]
MRLASRSIERRGDRVAPDADSEGEHVALRATGSRPHARRATPERVWLWFFLLLNLFGVCGFIFSSAFFFPSVSTTGVMKEAIDQGSVALLEIPKAPTEGPKLPPVVTVPSPLPELSRTQQTNDLVVKEHMTFFFVLAPSQVELGDTYRGQKFFGNVPYGQFLLHGGKPAFFSTTGLHELDSVLRNDEMSILVYRLHRDEPSAPPESLSVADLPRTFDPEGVFEWMPSDALLAAIGRNRDPAASLQKWKAAVREKIDAVRNFEFGGPVLLQFIHERRDELLTLRMELFG